MSRPNFIKVQLWGAGRLSMLNPAHVVMATVHNHDCEWVAHMNTIDGRQITVFLSYADETDQDGAESLLAALLAGELEE